MSEVIFLYDFEYVPYTNPSGSQARFEEGLKAFFAAHDMGWRMSALGGMTHTMGYVGYKGRPATEADRRALGDWAATQRIRCTARIGALEEVTDRTDFSRDVTEWVFPVDNLTPDDRAEAAAYEDSIRELGRGGQPDRD